MVQKRGKFERLDASIPIEVFLPGSSSEGLPVMCDNIGGKGVRFSINKRVEVNSRLELVIYLPDDQVPLRVRGRVSWVRARGMADGKTHFFEVGIEFLELRFQDKDRIHQYVYRRVQRQSPPEEPGE